MPRRSRREQIEDEKRAAGAERGWMTSGEVCKYLGISPRAFRLRRAAGTIPEPEVRTRYGWGLWSPAQTRTLLDQELERKTR